MRYIVLASILLASCVEGGVYPSGDGDGSRIVPAPSDSSYPDTTGIVYEPITELPDLGEPCYYDGGSEPGWATSVNLPQGSEFCQQTRLCDFESQLVTNDIVAPYRFPFSCYVQLLFGCSRSPEKPLQTVEETEQSRVKHREEILNGYQERHAKYQRLLAGGSLNEEQEEAVREVLRHLEAEPYWERDQIVRGCFEQQWSHVSGSYLRVGEETPFTVEVYHLSDSFSGILDIEFNEEQVRCGVEFDPLRLVCDLEWGAKMIEVAWPNGREDPPKVTLGISHGDEQFTVVTP